MHRSRGKIYGVSHPQSMLLMPSIFVRCDLSDSTLPWHSQIIILEDVSLVTVVSRVREEEGKESSNQRFLIEFMLL